MVLVAGLLGLLAFVLVSRLMVHAGAQLAGVLGAVAFVGTFVTALGEILEILLGARRRLAPAAVLLAGTAGSLVRRVREAVSHQAGRQFDLALASLAGAVGGRALGSDPRMALPACRTRA